MVIERANLREEEEGSGGVEEQQMYYIQVNVFQCIIMNDNVSQCITIKCITMYDNQIYDNVLHPARTARRRCRSHPCSVCIS